MVLHDDPPQLARARRGERSSQVARAQVARPARRRPPRRRRSGVDLRRRRNGMPIRYRPGLAVTPPSCTTRPLRSNTGDVEPGQVGPVAGRPDDRRDPAGAEARRQRDGRRHARSARTAAAVLGVDPGPVGPRVDGVQQPAQLEVGQRAHVGQRAGELRGPVADRRRAGRPAAPRAGAARSGRPSPAPASRPAASTAGCAPAPGRAPRRSARRARPTRPSTTGCRGPGRSAASGRARRRRGSPAARSAAAPRRSGPRWPRRRRPARRRRGSRSGLR